jgi:CRISPR/Cas system-associated protein Csx1
MAKDIIVTKSEFTLNSEKGHSVRYDAIDRDNNVASSIYVNKEAFASAGKGFPQRILVSIQAVE